MVMGTTKVRTFLVHSWETFPINLMTKKKVGYVS